MTDVLVKPALTEDEEMRAFAAALLKTPDQPMKAAESVIAQTGRQLLAATVWVSDPRVKEYQLELLNKYGADKFLPTEVDQLQDIYRIATNTKLDEEVRLKAHELYAKIRQRYFTKPDVAAPTNILANNVMVVNNHGTDVDWEQGLMEQQRKLTGRVQ